jgi:hypothetical protein
MTGGEANLGEITITKNGEYVASVDGVQSIVTKTYNSTIPFDIDLGGQGMWKFSDAVPNIEVFKNNSSIKVVDSNGNTVIELSYKDANAQWVIQDGVVAMSDFLYIVYDPAAFESMLGGMFGFEEGIYVFDQGYAAEGNEFTFTSILNASADGYSKVTIDVYTGDLDWYSASGVRYALINGDMIISGGLSISSDLFDNIESPDTIKNVFILNNGNITSIGNDAFHYREYLTSITIPESVTSIGDSAFNSCYSLTNITIPESVTSIGNSAFSDCQGLISVVIHNGVENINNSVFYNCSELTKVTIPESVTSINRYAFYNTQSLANITIPESVTSIGENAFESSGLTTINIPNGVKSIGKRAFFNCDKLMTIFFDGTIDQWDAITKGSEWNYRVPATHVQCSDGQVALA